jgi:hypothetical protein
MRVHIPNFAMGGSSPAMVKVFVVALITMTISPAFAAGWKVNDTISPLDGSRTYAAQVESASTLHEPTGDLRATMIVRCEQGVLESYIVWPQTLGQGPLNVRWHTDSNPPTTDVWTVAPGETATFSEQTRTLLAALRSAKTVSFVVTLVDFTTVQATFDVSGATPIVDTVIAACR